MSERRCGHYFCMMILPSQSFDWISRRAASTSAESKSVFFPLVVLYEILSVGFRFLRVRVMSFRKSLKARCRSRLSCFSSLYIGGNSGSKLPRAWNLDVPGFTTLAPESALYCSTSNEFVEGCAYHSSVAKRNWLKCCDSSNSNMKQYGFANHTSMFWRLVFRCWLNFASCKLNVHLPSTSWR